MSPSSFIHISVVSLLVYNYDVITSSGINKNIKTLRMSDKTSMEVMSDTFFNHFNRYWTNLPKTKIIPEAIIEENRQKRYSRH